MPAKKMVDVEENAMLQFARQLYECCLERHGNDHEQTRLLLGYYLSVKAENPQEEEAGFPELVQSNRQGPRLLYRAQ
jgi:hypothetical protein